MMSAHLPVTINSSKYPDFSLREVYFFLHAVEMLNSPKIFARLLHYGRKSGRCQGQQLAGGGDSGTHAEMWSDADKGK